MPFWSTKRCQILLLLILLAICAVQGRKAVDFAGYYNYVKAAWQGDFQESPYPQGEAVVGNYFQSPVVTVVLVPFVWLSLGWAKALYFVLQLLAFVALLPKLFGRFPNWKELLFLALIFVHPLADVFLSGNFNFTLFLLMAWGLYGLAQRSTRLRWLAALALSLCTFIKVLPAILMAWYLLAEKSFKKAMLLAVAHILWLILSVVVIGPDKIVWWFQSWRHSLGLYTQAAKPFWVAFQSPPAILYRLLFFQFKFPHEVAFQIENIFSLVVLMALLVTAALWVRRESGSANEPILLRRSTVLVMAAFYLASPFSWVCTLFFMLPLVAEYLQKQNISIYAWWLLGALALTGRDFWPREKWLVLAEASLPAWLLLALWGVIFHSWQQQKISEKELHG